jgi:hypothetical protein
MYPQKWTRKEEGGTVFTPAGKMRGQDGGRCLARWESRRMNEVLAISGDLPEYV